MNKGAAEKLRFTPLPIKNKVSLKPGNYDNLGFFHLFSFPFLNGFFPTRKLILLNFMYVVVTPERYFFFDSIRYLAFLFDTIFWP